MTSGLAIKVEKNGRACIYIGTDRQKTEYDGERAIAKGTQNKIWRGDTWALAYAGTVTTHLDNLRRKFEGNKKVAGEEWGPEKAEEMIGKAIENRFFQEIGHTTRMMRKERYSSDDAPEYLLATSDPLKLFYIDETGNMFTYDELCRADDIDSGELEYLVVGSGSQLMRNFIESKLNDDDEQYSSRFTVAQTPTEMVKILHAARKVDIDTSGAVSLVAVTSKKVYDARDRLDRGARRGEREEAEDFGIEIVDALEELDRE